MRSSEASDPFCNPRLIQLYVEQHWTAEEIRPWRNQRGEWLQVPSPSKANDRARRLGFNLDSGAVVDFVGGFKGSFVWFVIEHLGLSGRREAERYLTDLALSHGLRAEELAPVERPRSVPPPDELLLPEIVLPPSTLPLDLNAAYAQPYEIVQRVASDYLLHDRHITAEEARRHELRVCASGHFQNRLIIPVRDEWERLVWYQGRDLTGRKPDTKYLSPFETDRSRLVYNLRYIEHGARIVLCEGFFDAIRVTDLQRGVVGVVCFGKFISEYQLQRIQLRQPREIVLGFDADIAGIESIFSMLSRYGIPFRIVLLPPGVKDLGELTRPDATNVVDQAELWNVGLKLVLIARAAEQFYREQRVGR